MFESDGIGPDGEHIYRPVIIGGEMFLESVLRIGG